MQESGKRNDPAALAYRLFWRSVNLLFPPTCGGCGRIGDRWCRHCQATLSLIKDPICFCCGEPCGNLLRGFCSSCHHSRPAFTAVRSWASFEGPLRKALHRLKYKRDLGIGDALVAEMHQWVCGLSWPVNMIVPVPLSRIHFKDRGYNQVEMIARPLAAVLSLPYSSEAIERIRETSSQVGLKKQERWINVQGAFVAKPDLVTDKTVLVIDDTITTGATLDSCASALILAGAHSVYGITVARAM